MSTDTVSRLRQRMIEDMNARKLCAGTQRGHIRGCKRFAAFLRRSPETATAEDIRQFQLHLAEASLSICTRNQIMTGLRLWLRPACWRSGQAEGQAYRQCAEDHSGGTVEGPQGPQRDAVAGDARSVAPMVEGTPIASRCRNARTGTLAVSRQQARQADDDPPAEPPVPRGGRRRRDQEGRDAACFAPQLRDAPARARYRY